VRELKSTVTGKSFQQLTTRSLKNFDRTSAEQRFFGIAKENAKKNI